MAKKNRAPSDMANDILSVVREGTKKWTNTRKAEERSPASPAYRAARLVRERRISIKDAAEEIMEEAYMHASGDGSLPANARQIMYAARPHIQEATGRPLESNYFTQTLLPNYIEEYGVDWDVIYDARGHFTEPHGGKSFGLGTLEVRKYLSMIDDPKIVAAYLNQAGVRTTGPSGNFGAVFFCEKEGFDPLLRAARIAPRFDLAIMSCKGMSVTAARHLADEVCFDHDVPLLLLRDFDKAGFSISGTLQRDTRRYTFENAIEVIDLGLTLADVQQMGLEPEYQHHPKGSKSALEENLRVNGASEDEIAFMFQDFDRLRSTRRVELNAMTSPQFIAFVERKLRENGVEKIVPDQELLNATYAEMAKGLALAKLVKKLEVDKDDFLPPEDLEDRIRKMLVEHPALRWDAAIARIVGDVEAKEAGEPPS